MCRTCSLAAIAHRIFCVKVYRRRTDTSPSMWTCVDRHLSAPTFLYVASASKLSVRVLCAYLLRAYSQPRAPRI